MDLSARTVLVTGASRGFGRALAAELLGRSAAVYAGARDPGQVDLPGAKPIALDITDPASVAAAAQATGDVTVLINNAGSSTGSDLLAATSTTSAWRWTPTTSAPCRWSAASHPRSRPTAAGRSSTSCPACPGSASRRSAPTAPPSPRSGRSPTPCACSSPARASGWPDPTSATWTPTWGPDGHRAKVRPRRHRPDRRRRHRRRRLRDPRRQRRPPGAGRAGRRRLSALPAAALRISRPAIRTASAQPDVRPC